MRNFSQLIGFLVLTLHFATYAQERFTEVTCAGDYKHHLQGICTDESNALFWSFTTDLVKTDGSGKVLHSIEVENHHGDLCYSEGEVFVAVNLGRFNDSEGNADSWIYVYDSKNLTFLRKYEIQEVFHGAGGIAKKDGNFFVVGGLPNGVEENYVYEYDSDFHFLKKHIIKSGWTHLGIQTAAFHNGAWWFGCYGSPKTLLKTDSNFQQPQRFEFDCSLGITGISEKYFLVARGPKTPEKRCLGTVHIATSHSATGLQLIPE